MWLSATILFARQTMSAVLSLVTLVLALYFIGPEEYGVFLSATTLISILCAICNLGIGAYLLRNPVEPSPHTYHQAFTTLLLMGMAAIGTGLYWLDDISVWLNLQGFGQLAFTLLFSVPIVMVSRVPQCKLERQLDYRRVAKVELSATVFRFLLTLIFFAAGAGVWSLVYGWWGFHILTLLGFLFQSKYFPQLRWQVTLMKPMLFFGIKTWFARIVFSLRDLTNPLIVAKILGAEAVTVVSIVTNLCESAAIGLAVSQRISGGVFGKIQKQKEKLSIAVSEGTFFQILIVGIFQLIIMLIGQLFSSHLDTVWQNAFLLLPYFSVYYLVLALIQLKVSALFTQSKVRWIIFIHIVYVSILMSLSYFLSLHYGMQGYGVAVALSSIFLLAFLYQKRVRTRNDLLIYSMITAALFILVLFGMTRSVWFLSSIPVLFIFSPIRAEFNKLADRFKSDWLKKNRE